MFTILSKKIKDELKTETMIHLNASRESQHYNIQYENSFRYSNVVNITFNSINKLLAFLTIKLLQALAN